MTAAIILLLKYYEESGRTCYRGHLFLFLFFSFALKMVWKKLVLEIIWRALLSVLPLFLHGMDGRVF